MTEAHHAAIADIEVYAADEFAVRPRGHDDRFTDKCRLWQRIVRVTRQDHVDALNAARHLFVHVETVVRQDDNAFGTHAAHFVDHFLHAFVTNTEGVFREHPTRVGDWHIGEGLTDDGDFYATTFKELIGCEIFCRFVPFAVKNVLAEGGIGQISDQFTDAVRTQREFPMERHCVRFKEVHGVHHVLTLCVVAGVRPVPCVTAVQKDRIRTISADRLYDRRNAVEATHLAVGFTQSGKVIVGQRVMRRRSIVDPVETAEICARHVWNSATAVAYTEVDLRFAEIDRLQLRVNVGDVNQRHVAEGFERKQVVLGQDLLRGQTSPVAKTGRTPDGASGHTGLKKITA